MEDVLIKNKTSIKPGFTDDKPISEYYPSPRKPDIIINEYFNKVAL